MAAKKFNYTKKQLAGIWQETVDNLRNATSIDLNETPEEQRKRIKRLEADHEEWFKYYFPKFCYAKPAPFHIAASNRVIKNMEWYEVRMWSRELAKSTRTMMEVLYLCLTGKKKYVLLVSCNEKNAERLLMPYKANLEYNNALIHDYGEQQKVGSWEGVEFVTRKGVAFRGIGIDGQPRGTRNEEARPDVILLDDVDTDQDCRNPDMVKKNWDKIDGAIMGTNSISNACTVIFCGNRIAVDCCVVRACAFADHFDEINIRDEEGKSTWLEKNSEVHIDRRLAKRSYAAGQKEYFNNPIVEGSVFKEMAYRPSRPLIEYSMLVCYTDPSYKDTKKSDYKATVLVGKWQDEFHVIKAYVEQTTTAKMIEWHYEIMRLLGQRNCYYLMEEVFLQDLILTEFYKAGATTGKTIPITGDQRDKDDKFTRIEALLEPLHRNGKLYLNNNEKNNPHMKRLDEQFVALSPGSRAHDDGPDAVEGAVYIINNKITARAAGITVIPRSPSPKRF